MSLWWLSLCECQGPDTIVKQMRGARQDSWMRVNGSTVPNEWDNPAGNVMILHENVVVRLHVLVYREVGEVTQCVGYLIFMMNWHSKAKGIDEACAHPQRLQSRYREPGCKRETRPP